MSWSGPAVRTAGEEETVRGLVGLALFFGGAFAAAALVAAGPWAALATLAAAVAAAVLAWRAGLLARLGRGGLGGEAAADDVYLRERFGDVKRAWPWLGQLGGPKGGPGG